MWEIKTSRLSRKTTGGKAWQEITFIKNDGTEYSITIPSGQNKGNAILAYLNDDTNSYSEYISDAIKTDVENAIKEIESKGIHQGTIDITQTFNKPSTQPQNVNSQSQQQSNQTNETQEINKSNKQQTWDSLFKEHQENLTYSEINSLTAEYKEEQRVIDYYLRTGTKPENASELSQISGKKQSDEGYRKVMSILNQYIQQTGIEQLTEEEKYQKGLLTETQGYKDYNASLNKYAESLGVEASELTEDQLKDFKFEREATEELNPYVRYMERMQQEQEGMERGLLDEQTQIQRQTAEIASQQAMIQQAQFKDQMIEQIKTDRLGKMRQGISPMQIANEELQFMVGNMQGNAQLMSQANQQQLAATQQSRINPYQAYINSQQAITGGQGYTNFAAGMAATDASSLHMTALQIAKNMNIPYSEAIKQAQTNKNINVSGS